MGQAPTTKRRTGHSSSGSQAVYAPSAISDRGAVRINLAGVPQIPDALARMIVSAQGDDAEPTGALLEESEASIEAACREIRRRTELDRRRDSALTWRQAQ